MRECDVEQTGRGLRGHSDREALCGNVLRQLGNLVALENLRDEGLMLNRKRRSGRSAAIVGERPGERHGKEQVDSVWLALCFVVDPGEVNLQLSWAKRRHA